MLYEYIRQSMLGYPNRTVSDRYRCMTFEQLLHNAEQFSVQLKGIKKAGILCRSELDTAKYVLACLAAGVTAIPMSPRYGDEHVKRIIERTRPEYIITCSDDGMQMRNTYSPEDNVQLKDAAFIMCTSGTTGQPKGAIMTNCAIESNVRAIAEYFNVGNSDRILISRPLYHAAVMTGEFIQALVKGMDIVFESDPFDYRRLAQIISSRGITVFCGTPTVLYWLCRMSEKKSLATLTSVVCSGESMTCAAAAEIRNALPNTDIYNVYGLTEAGPRVSWLPPCEFAKHWDTVGYPVKGAELRIENGELLVFSPAVMSGYYNNTVLTETALNAGWLHTGDMAEFSDGRLRITGRKDDMIVRGGMNIYPREIEDALSYSNDIRAVLAYGVSGNGITQKIYLKAESDILSPADVMNICRSRLPSYQIPDKIEVVSELKRNASGKIVRPGKFGGNTNE